MLLFSINSEELFEVFEVAVTDFIALHWSDASCSGAPSRRSLACLYSFKCCCNSSCKVRFYIFTWDYLRSTERKKSGAGRLGYCGGHAAGPHHYPSQNAASKWFLTACLSKSNGRTILLEPHDRLAYYPRWCFRHHVPYRKMLSFEPPTTPESLLKHSVTLSLSLALSLSLSIYIYIYIYVCVCVCVCVYNICAINQTERRWSWQSNLIPWIMSCCFSIKCDGRNSPCSVILTWSGRISVSQGHTVSVSKLCVAFLVLSPFRDVILADLRVDQCWLKTYSGRGLLNSIGRASQCILM